MVCAKWQETDDHPGGEVMGRPKMDFKEPTNKEEALKLYKRQWASANHERNKANNDRINLAYKKLREINSTFLSKASDIRGNYNYFVEVE